MMTLYAIALCAVGIRPECQIPAGMGASYNLAECQMAASKMNATRHNDSEHIQIYYKCYAMDVPSWQRVD